MKFKEKYPNGLNKMIYYLGKAIFKVMTTDEIDKIMNYADPEENEEIKAFKEAFDKAGIKDWTDCYWIPSIQDMPAPILRDVIAIAVSLCNDDE